MNTASKPDSAEANTTPTQPIRHYSQQMEPVQNQEPDTLLKEGKYAALTINAPFTVIPGLPALNRVLARIDRTTHSITFNPEKTAQKSTRVVKLNRITCRQFQKQKSQLTEFVAKSPDLRNKKALRCQ
ncbi:MAG TPA: hypothetical protein VIO39_00140 [Methylotenera sp.]